jgi:hypothetical protein
MKLIAITKHFVKVDSKDFDFLSKFSWFYQTKGYVACSMTVNGKKKRILMHTLLMNTPKGFEVDHINGDGLDNRRRNLRIVTHAQNMKNHKVAKNSTTGHTGICYDKRTKSFMTFICNAGTQIYLGRHKKISDAVRVRKNKELEIFGEFARV